MQWRRRDLDQGRASPRNLFFVGGRCSWTLRARTASLAGVASSKEQHHKHWPTLPPREELRPPRCDNSFASRIRSDACGAFLAFGSRWRAHDGRWLINGATGHHASHHGPTWARGNRNRMSSHSRDDIVVVCTTIESVRLSCSSIVNTIVFVHRKCIDDGKTHVY